jgi:hypothetical protein
LSEARGRQKEEQVLVVRFRNEIVEEGLETAKWEG